MDSQIEVNLCTTILDVNYQNVYDFGSRQSQLNTFYNELRREKIFIKCKPHAYLKSLIVPKNIVYISPYDYCFLIEPTLNKPYFYFITKKEMLTSTTTELELELDVFQTYMFDYELLDSFIDRCHVPRWDELGLPTENNIDENLEYGSTQIVSRETLREIEDNYIICATTPIGTLNQNGGGSSGGENDLGNVVNGDVSWKMIRYLKGYEGFSEKPYYLGDGVTTAGYGITKENDSDNGYWNMLQPFPCTEKTATEVMIKAIKGKYGKQIKDKMLKDGLDLKIVQQQNFDAFVDLCYNCGFTGATTSPMYKKFLIDPTDASIKNDWLNYKIMQGTQFEQGLRARRKSEYDIYANGIYEFRKIKNYGGGYIEGDGYNPCENNELGEKICISARKLIGLPYVWGGNYPPLGKSQGTDCSGLCQWAYNDNNIKISRTTYTQINEGRKISLDNMQKGDLIFSRFSQPNTPEHVFLYSGKNPKGEHMCIEAMRTGTNILEHTFTVKNDMQVRRLI